MNFDVMWCAVIMFALCFIGAFCYLRIMEDWDAEYVPFLGKLKPNDIHIARETLRTVLVFAIIMQTIIPISLYVSIETAKLAQVYFINQDIELYDPKTNMRMECRSFNLAEELGQVCFLFFVFCLLFETYIFFW